MSTLGDKRVQHRTNDVQLLSSYRLNTKNRTEFQYHLYIENRRCHVTNTNAKEGQEEARRRRLSGSQIN
jgi:hypothetical protein